MKVLIADDERPARERMQTLLSRFPQIEIIDRVADGDEVLAAIKAHELDVIFMDIQMPGLSGIDTADLLKDREKPLIVFVTAYDQYALEAFNVKALDYLTKPVRPSRLAETIGRIEERLSPQNSEKPLSISTQSGMVLIEKSKILYACVVHTLLELTTIEKTYHLTWSLKQLEEKLSEEDDFLKISRQSLVNINHISSLKTNYSGTGTVKMKNEDVLDVSRSALKKLKERLPS